MTKNWKINRIENTKQLDNLIYHSASEHERRNAAEYGIERGIKSRFDLVAIAKEKERSIKKYKD